MVKDRFNPSTRYQEKEEGQISSTTIDGSTIRAGTIDSWWFGGELLNEFLGKVEVFKDDSFPKIDPLDMDNPSYRYPPSSHQGELKFNETDSSFYYNTGKEWVKVGEVKHQDKEENNNGN